MRHHPSKPSPSSKALPASLLAITLAGSFALTGCSVARLEPVSASPAAIHLTGHAHGGQQPVSGATIQLYAAGTSGNASAATPLLTATVLSDATGAFDITGDYTCPSAGAQVYITATGGNPGLGPNGNNPALALVDVLGDCGNLASTPYISIDEKTTVAAAWALAPFASSIASVGASATNTAGLRNAMLTAMMLVDPTNGAAPSASLPSNATTETAKLYALANVIASCVNSDGSTPCTQLFTDASPTQLSSLSDTFQASLSVTANPGNNVTALFNDQPSHLVFGGALTQAPSDWSMSVAYTGGGLSFPTSLAIDASGDILVSNAGGGVSGFNPQGTPLWSNGVSGSGLDESIGIAVDPSSNIWVTNLLSTGSAPGSITQLADSGAVLSGSDGITGGTINQPVAIAADASNRLWIANLGSPQITVLNSDGTVRSGPNGFGYGVLSEPSALAIDGSGNAWVADSGTGSLVSVGSQGRVLAQVSCCSTPDSLAIDSAGTVWVGDNTNSVLGQVGYNGTVLNTGLSGGGLNGPRAISIDGADHLWITNNSASTLTEFAGTNSPQTAATALSPSTGLGADALIQQPFGVGVDPSGNVWVTSFGDNRLVSFVGLGTPVQTPKIGLPQQP